MYMNNKTIQEQEIFELIKNYADLSTADVKVISLIGGAGSGKTTLTKNLVSYLQSACTLGTDDYVVGDRTFRRKYLEGADPLKKYKPEALNEIINKIKALKPGETCPVPTYNDKTGEAVDAKHYDKVVHPVKYIIVEGDFNFVDHSDLTVYFDVDDATRLQNRIERDKRLRGEADEQAITDSFNLRQKLQHIPYTAPVKDIADIVITATKDTPDSQYTYSINIKNKNLCHDHDCTA